MHELAAATSISADEAFAEIVKWYDGYRFHYAVESVLTLVSQIGVSFSSEKRTISETIVEDC